MLLGEIYDYDRSLPSDLYHVVEMYNRHGDSFTSHLDGEFLVIVFDGTTIDLFTDTWATRQAWLDQFDDQFYLGTFPVREVHGRFDRPDFYGSGSLVRLRPNSHYRFHVGERRLELVSDSLHRWDLTQYKTSFTDWNKAFDDAVMKRYHDDQVLCFSGGLDSSCIAACLSDNNKMIVAANLRLKDVEDDDTIRSVVDYCGDNMELHTYGRRVDLDVIDKLDEVGIGHKSMAQLSQMIRDDLGCRVVMQGNGADEIIASYLSKRLSGPQKHFWRADLESMFPYQHFYDGQMRRIIDYKEMVFLLNGQELRNVFLDRRLTQEWLSISHNVKNMSVKFPLKAYLLERGIHLPQRIAGGVSQEG